MDTDTYPTRLHDAPLPPSDLAVSDPFDVIDEAVSQTLGHAAAVRYFADHLGDTDFATRARADKLVILLLRLVRDDARPVLPTEALRRWAALIPWARYGLDGVPDPAFLIAAVLPAAGIPSNVFPGMFDGVRAELREVEGLLASWWPEAMAEYAELCEQGWSRFGAMQAVCGAFRDDPRRSRQLDRCADRAADEAMRHSGALASLDARRGMGQADAHACAEELTARLNRDTEELAATLPQLHRLSERRLLAAWVAVVPWLQSPAPWAPGPAAPLADAGVAIEVVQRIEAALRRRQPAAMRLYDTSRRQGLSPSESMRAAAQRFRPVRPAAQARRNRPTGATPPPSASTWSSRSRQAGVERVDSRNGLLVRSNAQHPTSHQISAPTCAIAMRSKVP